MEVPDRMARVKEMDDGVQVGLLSRAADFLDATHGARPAIVMGFCMGGYFALKAAATGRFASAVSFYGMITTPDMWAGPGLKSPLETAGSVCPTLAILGGRDQWTPEGDIAALRDAWRGRDDCEIAFYPDAEHGFVHDPSRPAHRASDAADAWERVLRWLA